MSTIPAFLLIEGPALDTIVPGDYLPPQPALHGTPYQHTGFQVGTRRSDVTSSPVLSGQVLLFNAGQPMLALHEDAPVLIHRTP